MTYDDLMEHVEAYFGDTSRPASETREDLLALADHCKMLAETIPPDGDDGPGEAATG